MVLGPLSKETLTPLVIMFGTVERLSVFKLLGVTITSALMWDEYVTAVVSKAVKRLWS